jgi:hypothetical protein
MTGINAFIFYSCELYKSLGVNPGVGVFWNNLINFIAVIPSIPLLAYFGRRPLMIFWVGVMFLALFAMTAVTEWISLDKTVENRLEIALNCVFLGGFELSFGPIFWLYLPEVCCTKSMSMAVLVSWLCSLIVSQITPYLFYEWIGNYGFLFYAIPCFLAFVFFCVFMKETKGLTVS